MTEDSVMMEDRVVAAMYGIDASASDFRQQALDRMGTEFEQAPNPMMPWSALRWARSRKLDIPEWVLDYFYGRAVALTDILAENAKKEAKEVARALGFGAGRKGRASVGAKLRQQWREYELAVRVTDLQLQGWTKAYAAIAKAAEDMAAAWSPAEKKARPVSWDIAYRAHKKRGAQAKQFVDIMKLPPPKSEP